jgi:Family of unknown function (DUF6152)
MRFPIISCVAIVLVCASLTGSAHAHHSFAAEFDANSTAELEGEITRVWFVNPHVRYRLSVINEDGATEDWELQLANVTTLRNINWRSDTLEVGDRVVVQGQLGRNGARKLYVRGARLADGTELLPYAARAGASDPNDPAALAGRDAAEFAYGVPSNDYPVDITGPWSNRYKFRVTVDDLEPKPTPFTEEAKRIYGAVEHYDDYALRCIAPGLPRMFGSPYNMEIVDAGTHYVVLYVEHNMWRRIYMDGRTPPDNYPPTSLGFSVGRWEDDVLVIETTRLLPAWLDGSGLPMAGEGTRIVERWALSDDRLSMDRTMTIYDPYYTEPLVRVRGSARGDNIDLIEHASCDPQSYYRDIYESGRIEEFLNR